MSLITPADIPQITGDLDHFEQLTGDLARDGDAFAEATGGLHHTFQQLGSFYATPEAETLLSSTLPVRQAGDELHQALAGLATALRGYAEEVRTIKARLDALRERAAAFAAVTPEDEDYSAKTAASDALRAEVQRLVTAFQRAEASAARSIDALLPAHGPLHPGPWAPGHEPFPHLLVLPAFSTPAEAAAWWNSLTPAEQAHLIARRPDAIGALDGLPADVRDQANRILLTREITRLEAAYERHLECRVDGTGAGYGPDWDAEREQLETRLAALHAVQDRLDDAGEYAPDGKHGELPPAFLLHFDPTGRGRLVIANGNPDTADHTAVYVPGTGSELNKAGGDIARMVDLWEVANEEATAGEISTITWIGYDAPPEIIPDAASRSYANDGAPQLLTFMDGLSVAQGGGDASNTTLIGHSYGSALIGAAAKGDERIAADSIIAVGSPGMHVSHASELGIGAHNVWSMTASLKNDQVPLGGVFHGESGDVVTTGRSRWGIPVVRFHPENIPVAGNKVPSMESFGAQRMATDATDHSDYWRVDDDDASQSILNQAYVVIGRGDDVLLAD